MKPPSPDSGNVPPQEGPLDPSALRMVRRVGDAGRRREEFRREGDRSFWSSLAFIGMVGWGIALPAVLAAFLGVWLERKYQLGLRWTVTILFAGVGLGCWNAWHALNQDRG